MRNLLFACLLTWLVFVPMASPEPNNFRGLHICKVEDTRGMRANGDAGSFELVKPGSLFRLMMGPTADLSMAVMTIESHADLPFEGGYGAVSNEEYFQGIAANRFAHLDTDTASVTFIVFEDLGDETGDAWVVYKATCSRP